MISVSIKPISSKMAQEQNKKKKKKLKSYKTLLLVSQRMLLNLNKRQVVKQLDKIELDDIQPSSRRYPYVKFTPEREIGNDLLTVENL